MRKPCEGSAMSDFSEGHYKYKAKNKFMKAAAQQAQQPLKGVVVHSAAGMSVLLTRSHQAMHMNCGRRMR